MRKLILVLMTLLVAISLVFTACESEPEFVVKSLDVIPPEVTAEELAKITAVVENIGGSDGTYAVKLSVDGVTAEVKETSLIVPGSSTVVTFSLTKDTPGAYEISIGELGASLVVKEKPTIKKVELKYDDGRPDGAHAFRGWGYLVRFLPPSTPFMINKVKIFGSLYGSGYEKQVFDVQIWDKNLEEIHSASYPHTKFSLSPAWVEIDIPDIAIDGDFYIYVNTYSPREGGVHVSYDSSVTNEHSEVTQNWEIADWFLPTPKENVNWMIRVVGTATISPD